MRCPSNLTSQQNINVTIASPSKKCESSRLTSCQQNVDCKCIKYSFCGIIKIDSNQSSGRTLYLAPGLQSAYTWKEMDFWGLSMDGFSDSKGILLHFAHSSIVLFQSGKQLYNHKCMFVYLSGRFPFILHFTTFKLFSLFYVF